MRIAKFKRLCGEYDYETILDEGHTLATCDDYVQITEWAEVEFRPLHDDAIVEKQLNALDKAESALRGKFQAALNTIEQKRQELRAITYVPERRTDGSVDEYLQ